MGYKVGDKVIIGKENHSYFWNQGMKKLEGTETVIEDVYEITYYTSSGFFLADDDIEGLAE